MQEGRFCRQTIRNLGWPWLSTFCFVQSQQAQGWQAAVGKHRGRSPGVGKTRESARQHLLGTRRQPTCGLPLQILLQPLSCLAAWGQADKAFFSPLVPAHQGSGEKACSREKGICEQPFPLPAAGVCREGRSHRRDVITCLWMMHRPPASPWAEPLQVRAALWLT